MKVQREPKAQLYLSVDEVAMLDALKDRFSSEWERKTGLDISRSETVRRMIYYLSRSAPQ